jgi:hypothetical protein
LIVLPLYAVQSDQSGPSTSGDRAARDPDPLPAPTCGGWSAQRRPLDPDRPPDRAASRRVCRRPSPALPARPNDGRRAGVRARRRAQPPLGRAPVRADPLLGADRDHRSHEPSTGGRDRAPKRTHRPRRSTGASPQPARPARSPTSPTPSPTPPSPAQSTMRASKAFSVSTSSRRGCGEVRPRDQPGQRSKTRSAPSAPATGSPQPQINAIVAATRSTLTGRRTVSWRSSTARSSTTTSRPTAPRTPTSSKSAYESSASPGNA